MVRQRLSVKPILSINSSNNSFEITLTPSPVLIPVQKHSNFELQAEHNNSLINNANSANIPKLVHHV